MIKTVGL